MQVTTYVGLDVGSEAHVLAAVDAQGDVVQRPVRCAEDADGYARLDAALAALGAPESVLVVCEATGHYWQNVVAHLWAGGWRVALLNPLRAARYAGEELVRTKTDAADAVLRARLGREKRPEPAAVTDAATGRVCAASSPNWRGCARGWCARRRSASTNSTAWST